MLEIRADLLVAYALMKRSAWFSVPSRVAETGVDHTVHRSALKKLSLMGAQSCAQTASTPTPALALRDAIPVLASARHVEPSLLVFGMLWECCQSRRG
jgi:hypothetical protein